MGVLDALAWAALPEEASVARLASRIIKDESCLTPATKTEIRQIVSDIGLPRGRIGKIQEATIAETTRQRRLRRKRQVAAHVPKLTCLRHKLLKRIQGAVLETWRKCSYRRPSGSWAGGDEFINIKVVGVDDAPNCRSESVKVWSDNNRWSGYDVERTVQVTKSWYREVFKHERGAITKKGYFILDRDAEAGEILVVEPSRGLTVKVRTRREMTDERDFVIDLGPMDWNLFQRQRFTLMHLVDDKRLDDREAEHLMGLLHMTDYIVGVAQTEGRPVPDLDDIVLDQLAEI
jgi:hypothetical protein